jgi:hypothetical protein
MARLHGRFAAALYEAAAVRQELLEVKHEDRAINPHQFLLLLHSLGVRLPASEVSPGPHLLARKHKR